MSNFKWIILIALFGLLVGIVGFKYFHYEGRLSSIEKKLTQIETSLASLQTQIIQTETALLEQFEEALAPLVESPKKATEVVFTFDDGPYWSRTVAATEIILDTLKQFGIKATFFIIGSQFDPNIVKDPTTLNHYKKCLQRMHADGHIIAIHDWAHIPYYRQSQAQLSKSIQYTQQKISEITGEKSFRYLRSPGGTISAEVQNYLSNNGYQHIYWHINAEPLGVSPQQYLNRLKNQLQQGKRGIILMHDRNAYMYLKDLINFLNSQKIKVISLSEWIQKYGLPATPLKPHQGKF